MPRPGLVAVKKTVKTKKGFAKRTYWVKANKDQDSDVLKKYKDAKEKQAKEEEKARLEKEKAKKKEEKEETPEQRFEREQEEARIEHEKQVAKDEKEAERLHQEEEEERRREEEEEEEEERRREEEEEEEELEGYTDAVKKFHKDIQGRFNFEVDPDVIDFLQETVPGRGGGSISVSDIEKMYPHPEGSFTISPQRLKAGATNKDDPDNLEPILDDNGNPVKRVVEFTRDFTDITVTKEKGIKKVSIEGVFYDKETGEKAAEFTRSFYESDDPDIPGVFVEHEYLKFKPEYQGGGAGSQFIKKAIQAYGEHFEGYTDRRIAAVTVHAAWIGRYTWAKMGFQWSEKSFKEDVVPYFKTWAERRGIPKEDMDAAIEVGKHAGHKFVSMTLDGKDPVSGSPTKHKVKDFMVTSSKKDDAPDMWDGRLVLDENDPTYQQAASYLGL